MLRLPSPFLSASSNVCFSHFGAELGFSASSRVAEPPHPQEGVGGTAQEPLPFPPYPNVWPARGRGAPPRVARGGLIAGPLPGPSPRAQGYWSLVRWRRARLSSSLMPAMR